MGAAKPSGNVSSRPDAKSTPRASSSQGGRGLQRAPQNSGRRLSSVRRTRARRIFDARLAREAVNAIATLRGSQPAIEQVVSPIGDLGRVALQDLSNDDLKVRLIHECWERTCTMAPPLREAACYQSDLIIRGPGCSRSH